MTVEPSLAVGSGAVVPSGSSSSSIGASFDLAIVSVAEETVALAHVASSPVAVTQAVFR